MITLLKAHGAGDAGALLNRVRAAEPNDQDLTKTFAKPQHLPATCLVGWSVGPRLDVFPIWAEARHVR